MAGGRPTKYNKDILESTNKYLKEWEGTGDVIPSIEGLSIHLQTSRANIYNWEKDHSEFFDILEEIRATQLNTLQNKGLDSTFNSNITKLIMGTHGIREKKDTNLSGAIGVIDLTDKTDEELQAIVNGSSTT